MADLKDRILQMEKALLEVLEGGMHKRLEVSEEQDEVDAVATGINILLEELRYELGEQKRLRHETDSVFQALGEPLAVVDTDGLIRQCNPALVSLTGFSEQELQDFPLERLYADPQAAQSFLKAVDDDGRLAETETELRGRDGEVRSVVVSGTKLPDAADGGYVWVARDLSELRTLLQKAANAERAAARADALEQAHANLERTVDELRETQAQLVQAQKMEALGRLAGGLAHDFNNLLLVIMGCTEALRAITNDEERAGTELNEIQGAAERASRLTRQLLAVSRQQPSQPRVVDLNEVVSGAGKMLRRLLGEDVELVTLLEQNPWPVRVDPGHIEQVLVNLAVNARDAMPEGGKLKVSTGRRSVTGGKLPGDYTVLAVEDDGTGMPEEVQARVFEPFFTTKAPGRGTGLGLSTCYGIVAQSGGHISVDSEPGRGTRFEVLLPRTTGKATATTPSTRIQPSDGGDERVLVVEDEPSVRSIIVRTLRRLGYEVVSASNGSEALTLVEAGDAGDFDLLITDIVMPHLGGNELARRLRARFPHLPVLYISGYADRYPEELADPEYAALLGKPFLPADLARHVRRLLDKARELQNKNVVTLH